MWNCTLVYLADGEARMNKLIYYAILGLSKPVAPIWFLLVARHWRFRARHAVYNYALENNLRGNLKRLWERNPTLTTSEKIWKLTPRDPWNGSLDGYIHRDPVPAWQFQLYFWLIWIWLDDDSVSDTYDDGHCRTFITGERRHTWQAKVFGKWLDVPVETDSKPFDHGDFTIPRFRWIPALIWQYRNTTMNLKYWNNY